MPVVCTVFTSLNNLYFCSYLLDFGSGKFAPNGNTGEQAAYFPSYSDFSFTILMGRKGYFCV